MYNIDPELLYNIYTDGEEFLREDSFRCGYWFLKETYNLCFKKPGIMEIKPEDRLRYFMALDKTIGRYNENGNMVPSTLLKLLYILKESLAYDLAGHLIQEYYGPVDGLNEYVEDNMFDGEYEVEEVLDRIYKDVVKEVTEIF